MQIANFTLGCYNGIYNLQRAVDRNFADWFQFELNSILNSINEINDDLGDRATVRKKRMWVQNKSGE